MFEWVSEAGESVLTGVRSTMDLAEHLAPAGAHEAEGVPILGNILSLGEAGYHTGAAIYDGVHGDRDGAVAQGASALVSAAGVVPGLNTALAVGDLAMASTAGLASTGLAAAGELTGDERMAHTAEMIPTSVSDLVADAAVAGTNLAFGPDEDRGDGTRQGEIIAGMAGTALPALPIAPIAAVTGGAVAAGAGVGLTEGMQALGVGASDRPGSTSGGEQEQGRGLAELMRHWVE